MQNSDIRQMMFCNNIHHWQVAEAIGISSSTLSLWLRYELTPERKKRVITAINTLIGEEKTVNA